MGKPLNVSVGDQVVTRRHNRIGNVIRITPTGRIVVRFDERYTKTFHVDGSEFGGDHFYPDGIEPMTETKKREIQGERTILRCKDMFKNAIISYEQAEQIIKILEGGKFR